MDSQIGFAWHKFQHTLNRHIQVNFAEQLTRIETKISGGTRELVTHDGNNFFAAYLGQGEHALVGQEAVRMTEIADELIYTPQNLDFLQPIPAVVALQLFAYYCAIERDRDIDQPRNLAKSVTVE